MKKLNFPVITKLIPRSKTLSMDEYLEFVEFNLKNNFDRAAYRKEKKRLSVNVPFLLK